MSETADEKLAEALRTLGEMVNLNKRYMDIYAPADDWEKVERAEAIIAAWSEPAPEAEEERCTWPEWGRIFQDERSITIMSEPWGQAPDEPITREAAERLLLTCSQMPRPRRVAAEAEEEG